MQLELVLSCEEERLSDGRIVLTPGKLVPKAKEEWRWMSSLIRDRKMPHQNRARNVQLFHAGLIRARRRGVGGHWEVELTSLADYMRSLEDFF